MGVIKSLQRRARASAYRKVKSGAKRLRRKKIQEEKNKKTISAGPAKRARLTAEERSILDGEDPIGTYDEEGKPVKKSKSKNKKTTKK